LSIASNGRVIKTLL